jgi:hypothetical protein
MKRVWIAVLIAAAAVAAIASPWLFTEKTVLAPGAGGSGPAAGSAFSGAATVPIDPTRSWKAIDDPGADGWWTEVFAERAGAQLARLASLLARPDPPRPEDLAELIAADFAAGDLVPSSLETSFEDRALRVERGAASAGAASEHRGAAGFAAALARVAASFEGAAAEPRFKIFGVEPAEGGVRTRQRFMAGVRAAAFRLEINATWIADWEGGRDGGRDAAAPRLRRVALEDFERVRTLRSAAPLFADVSEAALGRNPAWREQLLLGFNYWLERIQDNRYFALFGAPGLAVGDVDGDLLDDLYLCQEGGLPNLLFLQSPDGTLRDASPGSGADWLDSTRGALLADLDNDGDPDLAATALGNLVVAENAGGGRFAVRSILATTDDTFSLSAADFDGDADLDIYVAAYNRNDLADSNGVLSIGGADGAFVYHDASNGGPNTLFRNDVVRGGEWRFRDVTAEVGLDANNRRFSFASAWEDYDNDGDQDLYVANDFGRNNLYQNDGGRFTDVAAAAGVEDSASGMGITWGDYDRDGWMDLYVSNMFSSAGSRIAFQGLFKPGSPPLVRDRLQRFARGNTLLRNLGGGRFEDVSDAAAVTQALWAWSSNFIDINNDGWEDLVVANGYITTEDTGDL